MKWWEYVIVGVAVALIIGVWIFIIIRAKRKSKTEEKKDNGKVSLGGALSTGFGYLSEKEYKFYKALTQVSGMMGYVSIPKVELCDIMICKEEKIKANPSYHKKVDFVMFTEFEFRPALIIDLFDNTITDQSLFEMDVFTKRAVDACYIPIMKQETKSFYDINELKRAIEQALSQTRELKVKS